MSLLLTRRDFMATPEEWEEKIMPACRCKMVPYSHKEVGRTPFLGQLMIYRC
jgi:hypothetical protein